MIATNLRLGVGEPARTLHWSWRESPSSTVTSSWGSVEMEGATEQKGFL